jgi:membrane-bound serine protease (ClpP class)
MRVIAIEPNWRVRLLSAITNPNIAYILLLIGFYGILLEFLSPGIIFSGVIGAIALIVALFALNLLPINFAGVGLVLLGMALMTAEAFTPSFGVLGLGGIAALVLGSLFLFDGEIPGFTLSLPVIAVMTALSAAFLFVAAAAVIRSRRRKVTTGEAELLQSHGEVLRWSDREGEVLVHGERWFATGPRDLSPGQRVRVKAREGLKLLVELEPDSRSTLGGTPHAL